MALIRSSARINGAFNLNNGEVLNMFTNVITNDTATSNGNAHAMIANVKNKTSLVTSDFTNGYVSLIGLLSDGTRTQIETTQAISNPKTYDVTSYDYILAAVSLTGTGSFTITLS